MSLKNDFKAFSTNNNANIVSQEIYEESRSLQTGFPPDNITIHLLNKVLRQSSTIASVVANFIATQSGDNVLDDGDIIKLALQLNRALEKKITAEIPNSSLTQKGIVQLTDAVGDSNTLAVTQKLVQEIINSLRKDINNRVPNTQKVNGKVLSRDIDITSQDIFNEQAIPIPDKADLNEYITPGLYYQHLNVQAASGKNYPEPISGSLIVLKTAGIIQRYFIYNSSRIYTRSRYSNQSWTPWAKEYNTLNKPTVADIQSEPRYTTTIDLTGLSTERYYPVWWAFPTNIGANSWLTLHRPYSYDAEKKPFGEGGVHIAGLLLQMEGGGIYWEGDARYLSIKRINQNYRKTVREIRYTMMSIARPIDGKYPLYNGAKSGDIVGCAVYSGCYLRGGLTYFSTSNFTQSIHYSREDEEVELTRSLQADSNFEIKWMVKSLAASDPLLGKEYEDSAMPYSLEYDTRYQKK